MWYPHVQTYESCSSRQERYEWGTKRRWNGPQIRRRAEGSNLAVAALLRAILRLQEPLGNSSKPPSLAAVNNLRQRARLSCDAADGSRSSCDQAGPGRSPRGRAVRCQGRPRSAHSPPTLRCRAAAPSDTGGHAAAPATRTAPPARRNPRRVDSRAPAPSNEKRADLGCTVGGGRVHTV